MCAPILKRKLSLTLLFSLAVLCGCAHEYLLVLKNGDQIISLNKPKPQGTSYQFTGSSGEEHVIPQSRVVKIKTVSVVKDEVQKPPPSPVQPKKPKHWYFLWLA